jgi:hypothetical protein
MCAEFLESNWSRWVRRLWKEGLSKQEKERPDQTAAVFPHLYSSLFIHDMMFNIRTDVQKNHTYEKCKYLTPEKQTKKRNAPLGVMDNACNPRTWEAEAGGS